jgi:hypothetical protein
VPVALCVELTPISPAGQPRRPDSVHGLLARCASAVREVVTTIKSLIMLARGGVGETTLRRPGRSAPPRPVGPDGLFHLGERDLTLRTLREPAWLHAIAVHDRYQTTCCRSPPTPESGPLTTSASEPAPAKPQQKISSRLTANDITQDRLEIRS